MTLTHLYIITGATRGLGAALARALIQPGHSLLGLARHEDPVLAAQAAAAGVPLEQWAIDLSHGREAADMLRQWLGRPGAQHASGTLINNAGMIPRVAPLGDVDADDLVHAVRVNLEAPLALTSAFLGATRHWNGPRRVLNISSGLGRRAMASQAIYCGTKAAMDHYTRCVALEEAMRPNGARVCSLAPGVIDTDMQMQLRAAAPADFPDRARFEQLKTQGLLDSPEQAAARVLAWLNRPDFGMNPVADVRES